jgi:hypothetical protein
MLAEELWMILPVVPSNLTIRLSVELAGPVTSPLDPLANSKPVAPALTLKTCKAEPKAVSPVPPLETGSVPVTPVERGKPVALVSVPEEGVPSAPFLVTMAPVEPVLTARAVATPVPKPDTPVEIGRPVAFVSVPEEGVPNAPPFVTIAPDEPTLTAKAVATFVPNPETPVEIGSPVAFVSVPDEGVPNAPPGAT